MCLTHWTVVLGDPMGISGKVFYRFQIIDWLKITLFYHIIYTIGEDSNARNRERDFRPLEDVGS
jgi:hypothetical protein